MRKRRVRPIYWILLGGAGSFALILFATWRASARGLVQAPAPTLEPDLPAPEISQVSSIAAPITLPLSTLAEQLEQAVPRTFGDIEERIVIPERDRTRIAFELRRAPFRVSLVGEVASLETTVEYALRAWYDPPLLPALSASCGTGDRPAPRLRVRIEAPITVEDDWSLSTRSRVAVLDRATQSDRDRCRMTFLDFDVTDRIVSAARSFLEDHTADIDSAAARVDLKSRIEEWWTTIQEPIRLTDSLWLVFRPETVRRGATEGSGDSLEIALAMRARPGIMMGRRPSLAYVELPVLDTGVVSPGLDLVVEAFADYPAVSAFLQDEVGGTEVQRAGRTIRLDSLRVFGVGGGRLALEVLTSGDVVSRLFLTGTPQLDPTTGQFSIPDLDYDVRTRSVLFATLSWLGNRPLRDLLRERASWPATPAIAWLRSRLLEGLNRELSDELRVSGEVADLRILGIHAMQEMLLVRVTAKGTARLFVIDDSASAAPPRRAATAAADAQASSGP
jgi:hypothetical protein